LPVRRGCAAIGQNSRFDGSLPGIFVIRAGRERRFMCDLNNLPNEFPCRPIAKMIRLNREIIRHNREKTGNSVGLPLAAAHRGDDRIGMCPSYQLS
jgi:hypothetical protein